MVRVVILHLFIGDIGVCIPGGGGWHLFARIKILPLGCLGALVV